MLHQEGGVRAARKFSCCDDEYDSVVGGIVPYWHGKGVGERFPFSL